VVKCQVHAGGRGKAGGVKVARSKDDVRAFVEQWLGKQGIHCVVDQDREAREANKAY
jgi:succinyl-CoA synthetase beta subunit